MTMTLTRRCSPPRRWRRFPACSPTALFPALITKGLAITITEVYPGAKWQDLAVSELEVLGGRVEVAPPPPKQAWKEADFVGEWVFDDGLGYTVKPRGRAVYNGPDGGPIDWYLDASANEIVFNSGHDHFQISSRDELRDTIVGQVLRRKKR